MSAASRSSNNRSMARGNHPSRSRAARSGRIRSDRETRNANQDRSEGPKTNNVQKITLNACLTWQRRQDQADVAAPEGAVAPPAPAGLRAAPRAAREGC